ncbi:RxLR-like protein [Plasmopara halstedii]|uniref:RxLR-like protein n=1 Tax=Plasmopara halstedii TaxID=4781 RepID=A0A0P1ABQ3_PLAHL|nr:RxLR-like protein [Plasmopara halstedii]CEG37620.1 RxLR-like protein [Plasmopara halstedii]|eukprot:XP_024573989.1 RxLR-like protein [Plasmopara halstedii]
MRHQPFLATLLVTITLHASGIPSLAANVASSGVPLERPLSKLVGTVDKRHLKAGDAAELMETEERTRTFGTFFANAKQAKNVKITAGGATSTGVNIEKVQAAVKNFEAPKDFKATREVPVTQTVKSTKDADVNTSPGAPVHSGSVVKWLKGFMAKIKTLCRRNKSEPALAPSTVVISEMHPSAKSSAIIKDIEKTKVTKNVKPTTTEKKAEAVGEGSTPVTSTRTAGVETHPKNPKTEPELPRREPGVVGTSEIPSSPPSPKQLKDISRDTVEGADTPRYYGFNRPIDDRTKLYSYGDDQVAMNGAKLEKPGRKTEDASAPVNSWKQAVYDRKRGRVPELRRRRTLILRVKYFTTFPTVFIFHLARRHVDGSQRPSKWSLSLIWHPEYVDRSIQSCLFALKNKQPLWVPDQDLGQKWYILRPDDNGIQGVRTYEAFVAT